MSSTPDSAAPPVGLGETLVGRRVNKYEIVRVIGRGGMGMVYEALNTTIGKRVAMKFVDTELARNKDAVARFQREAQAASAVESAHIVEIFDSGFTDDGLPYIVMELLRGEDLGHRIKRCGRLELGEALHVIAQILRGLHRAHEAGIVHRDLKPDNIFLVDRDDDANFAKVLDFGISKVQRRGGELAPNTLTRQGTVLGTPFYMSPEQAQALADIDGRTDLWSVGAILYECLAGRPPHSGGSYEQVIIAICMKDIEDLRVHNPAVPEPIARIVQKALTRDRDQRFATAREFLDALVASSGGLISQRSARSDDGAATSNPGSTSTPGGMIGSTPHTPGSGARQDAGLAPTLEVGSGGPSRIGWSTNGQTGGKRDKRVFAMVAVASLALGSLGAVIYFKERSDPGPTASPVAADASVQLRSNVERARFLVGGVEVPGGVLRGAKGERKTVRVEAAGFAPIEHEVTLDGATGQVEVVAGSPAPSVDPAAPAPETSGTAVPREPPKPRQGKLGGHVPGAAQRPTGAATAEAPAAALPPPPPKATGVAGGLQLKTD